jgi:hypothetical protein
MLLVRPFVLFDSRYLPMSKVKALTALLEMTIEKLVWVLLTAALVLKYRFTSVVFGAIFVVGQYFVRFTNVLKFLLCLFYVIRILVGVPFQCQFTIGLLDFTFRRLARNPQNFVVILFLRLLQSNFRFFQFLLCLLLLVIGLCKGQRNA